MGNSQILSGCKSRMADVSERQLHLVRHGEVENPDRVLYGRIPGFRLSEKGHEMALAAAKELSSKNHQIAALYASPLERAQQSAAPISKLLDLKVETEEGIIEPTNWFEGMVNNGPDAAFKNPKYWYKFWNPFLPSWGEPYRSVANRVIAAMDRVWEDATLNNKQGDIVMVSHQSPIWMAHRAIAQKPLFHNPSKRRCDLSSITSFTKRDGVWIEVNYRNPAGHLLDGAIDVGAV